MTVYVDLHLTEEFKAVFNKVSLLPNIASYASLCNISSRKSVFCFEGKED